MPRLHSLSSSFRRYAPAGTESASLFSVLMRTVTVINWELSFPRSVGIEPTTLSLVVPDSCTFFAPAIWAPMWATIALFLLLLFNIPIILGYSLVAREIISGAIKQRLTSWKWFQRLKHETRLIEDLPQHSVRKWMYRRQPFLKCFRVWTTFHSIWTPCVFQNRYQSTTQGW